MSKIFDPLGWLSPVTVVAKLFIEKLWLLHCTWDEELHDDLKKEWLQFTYRGPSRFAKNTNTKMVADHRKF